MYVNIYIFHSTNVLHTLLMGVCKEPFKYLHYIMGMYRSWYGRSTCVHVQTCIKHVERHPYIHNVYDHSLKYEFVLSYSLDKEMMRGQIIGTCSHGDFLNERDELEMCKK